VSVNPNGHAGCDLDIAESAWVSTGGADDGRDRSIQAVSGLLNYLMKHRHGTPFEEGYLSVTVDAPIFVAREWMRHRVGSYSERSARYTVLEPVFWVPRPTRGVVNAGKPARPKLSVNDELHRESVQSLRLAYQESWAVYMSLLDSGVAPEVARSALPVAIYTRFRARFNPRSLMAFLSLRWDHPNNQFPTYPQAEIQDAAERLGDILCGYWPLTWQAWDANGRIAP
jgi:thymidylate synthase (FAD)